MKDKNIIGKPDIGIEEISNWIREFLEKPKNNLILFYAANGTGKTRLSRLFYETTLEGRDDRQKKIQTLYFNSLTEDLFTWDNELRILRVDRRYQFTSRLESEDFEGLIGENWTKFSELEFSVRNIDTLEKSDYWEIEFFASGKNEDSQSIKISRAEERLFIWSFFEVILEKAIKSDEEYRDIKYIYIDDPISSMDENNAVKFAMILIAKIKNGIENGKKFIISSHHSLFFNIVYNNFGRSIKALIINRKGMGYSVLETKDKIFMSHLALMQNLQIAINGDSLSQHHFGNLRIVFEKTAVFLGYSNFSACIKNEQDRDLFSQALNLWSHGNHSIFETSQLLPEQRDLFIRIFNSFKEDLNFKLDSPQEATE